MDEREQDLLQVEARVERAGGADDRAVLQGAGGAALLGLQAREAGGGLVGDQLRDLDVLGRDLAAAAFQPISRTWRTSSRQAIGTKSIEKMPYCSARAARADRVARASETTRGGRSRVTRWVPGRAARRSARSRRRLVTGSAPAPSWLISQQRGRCRRRSAPSARRGAQRQIGVGGGRRSGLVGEAAERTHVVSALISDAVRSVLDAFPPDGLGRSAGPAELEPTPEVSRRRGSAAQ